MWLGLASTATGWALPGQVAMVELVGTGASLAAIAVAVALSGSRLLPMTVTLVPQLIAPDSPRWRAYVVAHWIAVTSWLITMSERHRLDRGARTPFFLGFALTLWLWSLAGTVVGFTVAGAVPPAMMLGLVFLNPIYFLMVLAADATDRGRVVALGSGAVLGPMFHLVTADWGLMLTGFAAGSAGFLASRAHRNAHRLSGTAADG